MLASQGAACARPLAASRPAPASSAAAAASRALSVPGQAPGAAGGARCAPGPAAGGLSCVGSAHRMRAARRAGRALARRSGALTCAPRQTLGKAWAGGRPLGALDDIRQNGAQAATCKGGGQASARTPGLAGEQSRRHPPEPRGAPVCTAARRPPHRDPPPPPPAACVHAATRSLLCPAAAKPRAGMTPINPTVHVGQHAAAAPRNPCPDTAS